MPDIPIAPPYACPSCRGTGTLNTLKGSFPRGHNHAAVPCGFCNGTGDQRQMPDAWRNCPSRNRAAYAKDA